jgi:hypothetical protein
MWPEGRPAKTPKIEKRTKDRNDPQGHQERVKE